MKQEEQKLRDPYYQKAAKHVVDNLFNNGVFNEKLSRNDLQSVEDLIAFYFDSYAHTARRAADIVASLEKSKIN